ncbi:restriction endonuclease, partial [Tolypothrix sp. LEGE 11397]|nr:restriction endonuclease [Tolypothrix sp. LEGE 11397]
PGKLPLTFLDHRIKCGNSLVGVLDINCLKEGIPDEAYKAVTGDDKKLATQLKKRNKKERETDNQGQLSLFGGLEPERTHYAETVRELGHIAELTPQQVREKQTRYQQTRKESGWWRDYSACNLWTAAFFTALTEENLQLLPTTAALTQLLHGNLSTQKIVDAANKLAEKKHFFHWCLEFPEVFEQDGFDCVLGNPPWERIKLQEKEFFASQSAEIANAINKAAREKLIKELPKNNPELAQAFDEAKHDAEAQSKFIRESGRFPLTAVGDINTYTVFAETIRRLISNYGRLGVIVPTAIATSDTTKNFFNDLISNHSLVQLIGFINEKSIFTSVLHNFRFCILSITGLGSKTEKPEFIFECQTFQEIDKIERHFTLHIDDLKLLNPNTLTCPVFRTSDDTELTKKIYQRVPVLENEQTSSNPWVISFMRMFDMTNDGEVFAKQSLPDYVRLFEGKMIDIFEHRSASSVTNAKNLIRSGQPIATTLEQYIDPNYLPTPQYWVSKKEVLSRLPHKSPKWFIGFKSVTSPINERTFVATILPFSGVGNSIPLILADFPNARLACCLLANLNSLVFDFVVKQKIGGVNLNFFIVKQLPVLPPKAYTQENIEFISTRVLELVYTAWDMQPFANDMGYDGEPFIWNNNRRALLRAELDAYYAKLYGLTRDELRYILDPADVYGEDFPSETFRVLKNNEIKKFGEYRTQRLVLEAWDTMFK